MRRILLSVVLFATSAASQQDPLAAWRSGVKVRPATPHNARHTIHTYFNLSPESPDGRWLLYYTSATPEGHEGDIRILERATGKERVLVRNVTTEDAHRAACQQWISGGRRVVFHDLRQGTWVVGVVDIETGKERVLAKDRLVSWGAVAGDIVPIYGKHWDPGPHRDLELVNVSTGEIRKTATAAGVRASYGEPVSKQFGDKPISIFFPILSPDGNRIFFKLASSAGGDFRSAAASNREILIGYDLERERFLFLQPRWGHPGWLPDSRTILNVGTLTDSNTGTVRAIAGLPKFRGSHPSSSPDGRLFVTDAAADDFGGKPGEWAVAVAKMEGGEFVMLHRFDGSKGAKSWRRSHPHPAFSADGKRIYFNVNAGAWTELWVAEVGK
jgi:Tol biopolymer transport system component